MEIKPFAFRISLYIITGILVFVLFFSFLVTAIAQQNIANNLRSVAPTMTYETSYSLYNQREEVGKQVDVLGDQLAEARSIATSATAIINRENAVLAESQSTYESAKASINLLAWCPELFGDAPQARTSVGEIQLIKRCETEEGKNLDEIREQYQTMRTESGRWLTAKKERDEAQAEKTSADATISRLSDQVEKYEELRDQASSIYPAFLPQQRLENIFGFPFLFSIPPSILPILLSFTSGLFGALLITLILIVYPNNNYSVSRHGDFFQHVFLGGIIAMAIFVVLGAGSSVLGFNNSGLGSPENFLSYAAIGIFSGMFSNRAADWLSNRADFRSSETPGTATQDNVGG